MGKSGVLEHKRSNISETRKDRGKVTMERNSPTLFRMVPTPTPLRLPLPRDWGSQPPKIHSLIISGTGKFTDFKFGRYIRRIHLNKGPFKIVEKRERERIHGLSKFFFEYPLLSQKRGKLRTFNFVRTFTGSIEQKPNKNSGKSSCGRTQRLSKIFMAPYIRRIARSSLR